VSQSGFGGNADDGRICTFTTSPAVSTSSLRRRITPSQQFLSPSETVDAIELFD
jgi:hypothetical protein